MTAATSGKNRNASVDAWRFIAIVAVVTIHATPESVVVANRWTAPADLLDQVARFAVPYFFIVSGYYWGEQLERGVSLRDASVPRIYRLLTIFAVWTVIYSLPIRYVQIPPGEALAPLRAAWWHLHSQLVNPARLLMQGTNSHLWFLPALICAIAISAVVVRFARLRWLFVVGTALYLVELLSKPYVGTSIGVSIDFNTRNGPFVGTLFFATGYALAKRGAKPEWAIPGAVLAVAGCALHIAENALTRTQYGADGVQEFVVGTYPMGLGVALVALSGSRLPANDVLARAGRYTLGVYLIHWIFVDWLSPVRRTLSPLTGELLTIVVATVLSLVAVRALSSWAPARRVML
jgi:surface polysaccharide O-acyltransferase-like enzyme